MNAIFPPAGSIFRLRDFRYFLIARFLSILGHHMMIIVLSQAIYDKTHDPIHLGYIGLATFLPKFLFTLPAGHVADRFDRQKVVMVCRALEAIFSLSIAVACFWNLEPLILTYALLLVLGIAYAFDGPATQAIITQLVPTDRFAKAVSWNMIIFHTGMILGPVLGGWIFALGHGPFWAVFSVFVLRMVSTFLVSRVPSKKDHIVKSEISWESAMAGVRYVLNHRIILGAISLDLFAVLLGGATSLMPIFANDILKIGPSGLGILRTAPAVGSGLMAILMIWMPPMRRAGRAVFLSVAIFGLATIGFGVSTHLYLSLFLLFVMGAADMISVMVRQTLVQVETPPQMRGRVSAVNLIFIGASNELGEFESGLTAKWFGTVPAVVIGGTGTMLVAGLWAKLFPGLRKFGPLEKTKHA